jgi:subtilisin family serine protease
VVNAAGNEGTSSWHYIGRPADAFDILAVGAVDKDSVIAWYSSYGPAADGRVKPDVASAGHGAWVVYEDGDIGQASGTSCAAPIIAGLSACLWQALPQYSSLEIMQLIRKYSDCFNNPNDRTGYGIPNYYQLYLDHAMKVPENKMPSFVVYPNPTSGEFQVTSVKLQVTNIEIFDIVGRKLSHISYLNSHISYLIYISHLQAGIYFLKIVSDNSFEMVKVIKK